jgi:hypothetical protein
LCEGVEGNFDHQVNNSQPVEAETVTFNAVGPYQYIIYVGEYLDKTYLGN